MIPASLAWWLYYHAGLSSANSPWYLFWSGIGADWTRLLTLGGLVAIIRQRTKQHLELKRMHERHHQESMERAADE